jgi:hypothetical protein
LFINTRLAKAVIFMKFDLFMCNNYGNSIIIIQYLLSLLVSPRAL